MSLEKENDEVVSVVLSFLSLFIPLRHTDTIINVNVIARDKARDKNIYRALDRMENRENYLE